MPVSKEIINSYSNALEQSAKIQVADQKAVEFFTLPQVEQGEILSQIMSWKVLGQLAQANLDKLIKLFIANTALLNNKTLQASDIPSGLFVNDYFKIGLVKFAIGFHNEGLRLDDFGTINRRILDDIEKFIFNKKLEVLKILIENPDFTQENSLADLVRKALADLYKAIDILFVFLKEHPQAITFLPIEYWCDSDFLKKLLAHPAVLEAFLQHPPVAFVNHFQTYCAECNYQSSSIKLSNLNLGSQPTLPSFIEEIIDYIKSKLSEKEKNLFSYMFNLEGKVNKKFALLWLYYSIGNSKTETDFKLLIENEEISLKFLTSLKSHFFILHTKGDEGMLPIIEYFQYFALILSQKSDVLKTNASEQAIAEHDNSTIDLANHLLRTFLNLYDKLILDSVQKAFFKQALTKILKLIYPSKENKILEIYRRFRDVINDSNANAPVFDVLVDCCNQAMTDFFKKNYLDAKQKDPEFTEALFRVLAQAKNHANTFNNFKNFIFMFEAHVSFKKGDYYNAINKFFTVMQTIRQTTAITESAHQLLIEAAEKLIDILIYRYEDIKSFKPAKQESKDIEASEVTEQESWFNITQKDEFLTLILAYYCAKIIKSQENLAKVLFRIACFTEKMSEKDLNKLNEDLTSVWMQVEQVVQVKPVDIQAIEKKIFCELVTEEQLKAARDSVLKYINSPELISVLADFQAEAQKIIVARLQDQVTAAQLQLLAVKNENQRLKQERVQEEVKPPQLTRYGHFL